MRGNLILIIAAFIFNFSEVSSQEIKLISLEEVLSKVATNNQTNKIAEKEVDAAKADFNQTNAFLLPSLTVSHSGISTTNPLMAFGSKLNQEILTQADFNPALLNDPDQIQNFTTKVELKQPLFNADGLFYRKAAKLKMNAYELQATRTKEGINLEVAKTYMQLQVAYKAIEVLKKAKETAFENKKLATNNFEQGYMQKSDLLLVEMYVNEVENQLVTAQSSLVNTSNLLYYLMGEENEAVLKPSEELVSVAQLTSNDITLSENRADFEALEKSTEAYTAMHKGNKLSYLPRLNAFGTYEMYDDQLFNTSAKGYLVGAQLSWDVFQGFQRIGKIQKSKAELDKAEITLDQYKNQSTIEFKAAKRQLTDAQNKLNLANLSVEQSKEAYRIRKNRYDQGLEKTTDLLQSETQSLQKQLEQLQAVFNYNFTQAYVTFLSK